MESRRELARDDSGVDSGGDWVDEWEMAIQRSVRQTGRDGMGGGDVCGCQGGFPTWRKVPAPRPYAHGRYMGLTAILLVSKLCLIVFGRVSCSMFCVRHPHSVIGVYGEDAPKNKSILVGYQLPNYSG